LDNQFILTPYYIAEHVPALLGLEQAGWWVNDPAGLPTGTGQDQMLSFYRPLRDQVAATVKAGDRPVSIAGDCCTSLAVLAGLQQAGSAPTLIWLDAHGDFNDWSTTPSGFLGGMPLAMMVGRGDQTIPAGLELQTLPEDRVILSDARDLDPGEAENLAESQVRHVRDVTDLLTLDLPAGPLWVHFDTDILDPVDAPAMNYPTPGGPPLVTMQRVFQRLADTGRVVAVSMSSWNPALEGAGRSAKICFDLLQTLTTGVL